MEILSKEKIDELIRCEKMITDPPRKKMALKNRHFRNDMKLQSVDNIYHFKVFMRVNEAFEEDFSIGLVYLPNETKGDLCLLRCNGPHGAHVALSRHYNYHVHIADPENIKNGLKAERTAFISEDYASYQEAEKYFLKRCNIINACDYFKPEVQLKLFNDD